MLIRIITICLFLLYLNQARSQIQNEIIKKENNNAYVFEFLGRGVTFLSVHYERKLINRQKFSWLFNVGASVPIIVAAFPINSTIVFGSKNNKVEVGGGIIIYKNLLLKTEPSIPFRYYPSAIIGYRYEPVGEKWFGRLAFTPYFVSDFAPWGGFSYGRKF